MTRELSSLVSRHKPAMLGVIFSLLVFGLAYTASVSYAASDPRFSLLVSQALREQHTIKLDAYVESADLLQKGAPIIQINGHYYYYFPLGTSIFSIPFVWSANLIGKDMAILAHDVWTQNLISALLCALIFLVLYHICLCYLNTAASFTIAAISTLGSALISTLGTALWSLDFSVLFASVALLLIVRYETGHSHTPRPYLLGSVLFSAFFCRPTSAVFIALALLYLLLRHRQSLVITASVAFALLLIFQLANWLEFRQSIFASYYSPQRFQVHTNPLGLALYGHFFSPSRGILIFSPFFALALAGAIRFFRALGKQRLFWLSVLWFGLHVLAVSRSTRWWGGHSFGPRVLTDALPALILLTVLVWRALSEVQTRLKTVTAAGYILLGLWGVYVNSYQGLYNYQTARWNGHLSPNVDDHPEYLLDWRHPQFLATYSSLCNRNLEHITTGLERNAIDLLVYSPGELITFHSGRDKLIDRSGEEAQPMLSAVSKALQTTHRVAREAQIRALRDGVLYENHQVFLPFVLTGPSQANALFAGWSRAEEGFRWSECSPARIFFQLGSIDSACRDYTLEVISGSLGKQTVIVYLNGTHIGDLSFSGPHKPPEKRALAFNAALLVQGGLNEIRFDVPGAARPSEDDPRHLGLAFAALSIAAAQ